MKSILYNNNKGFTLLEIVVALAISAMTLPALLQAFSNGIRNYSIIENRTTAYYLLKLKMGQVEMTGYPEVGSEEGDFGDDSRFKWATEVNNTDTDGLREVIVTISWEERGSLRSVELSTFLADRSIEQQQGQTG
ncbi:TPA: type II secretion system protein GspI [bacterium]|jgi:general secretion pathway protein I|nr:type II secretion system protein GspI [bacterium]